MEKAHENRKTQRLIFVYLIQDAKGFIYPQMNTDVNYFLITRMISPGALSVPFESTART